ncbi:MAG: energy transducer TonB [Bacteroidota bacterium]
MTTIRLCILLLFIPKLCIAQLSPDDKLIFLDSTYNETQSEYHHYYRIIKDCKSDKESYAIQDFYKSGGLLMEGKTSNKNHLIKEGQITYYYKNGNKKSVSNYVRNRPEGKETKWYENGTKQEEGEYFVDHEKRRSGYKVNQYWDTSGIQKVTDGNGNYEQGDKYFFITGKIKDGLKDGSWQGWADEKEKKCTEIYRGGAFISGTTIDVNGTKYEYNVIETKAKPQKGMDDFYQYIKKNFDLSNLIKGTNGKIYVSFVVDKDGKITNPKILKGMGYGTDDESIRVLTNYENWIPGERRGRKIRCSFTLPLNIKS